MIMIGFDAMIVTIFSFTIMATVMARATIMITIVIMVDCDYGHAYT